MIRLSPRPFLAAALAVATLASPAMAADWTVDPAKSTIGFAGTQSGTSFNGTFGAWTAEIAFDPAKPEAGHAVVTIDVSSAATGDGQKDASLPESDWFDAAKFPKAVFEAKSFRPKGGDDYEAVGTLTIRDTTRDVVLPMKIDINGDTAHATGSLKLIRTDYGVGQGSWANGEFVALDVAVSVDVTATRKN